MANQRMELSEELEEEIRKRIGQVVEEASKRESLTLGEIERLVEKAGRAITRELTAALVEEEAKRVEAPGCPECGGKMRYKGKKKRDVVSKTGELQVNRDYYYCEACRTGLFPPG
jgi:uncharacterized protein with PIN domain